MRRLGVLTIVAAIAMVALVVGVGVRATTALFGDQETVASSWSTAACFSDDPGGPPVTASVISKTTPFLPGSIRQGAAYYVYANALAGGGGPPARVSADVRTLTPGEFIAPLAAGAYSVGGVAYGWRSALLTASSPLGEGPYAYSVSAATASSLCRTVAWSVDIDNTRPVATDVQLLNTSGGTVGRPETGDTVEYVTSEVMDPETILPGWDGTSTNVVVRILNNANNDNLRIRNAADSALLPMGTVQLGENYVTGTTRWGVTGTPSTMVQNGTTITVTLGTLTGSTLPAAGDATALWNPPNSLADAADNALTNANPTESGAADPNF